jgi:hypothetical protein
LPFWHRVKGRYSNDKIALIDGISTHSYANIYGEKTQQQQNEREKDNELENRYALHMKSFMKSSAKKGVLFVKEIDDSLLL